MCLGKKNEKHLTVSDPFNGSRQHALARTVLAKLGLAAIASLYLLLSAPSRQAQVVNATSPPAAQPQRGIASPTSITVDANEPMFTTMCALLDSGFEANVS